MRSAESRSVGRLAIPIALGVLLGTTLPNLAHAEANCRLQPQELTSLNEAVRPDAIVRYDGDARRALKRLLGSVHDRVITTAEVEAIDQIDFLYGIRDQPAAVYRFYYGVKRLKRLCGFDLSVRYHESDLGRLDDGPLIALADPQQQSGENKPSEPLPSPDVHEPEDNNEEEESLPADNANQVRAADQLSRKERESLTRIAGGVSAFLKTATACFYEAPVSPAIGKLDDLLADRFGSYWASLKQQTEGSADVLQSLGPLMRSADVEKHRRAQGLPPTRMPDQCQTAGLAVAFALIATTGTIGFQPEVMGAQQRLIKGGGRSR